MTEDLARSTAGILPLAVLILALGCGGHSPSAPPTAPTPAPTPTLPPPSASMSYHVSGIVTDDNGSPIANADVTVRDVARNEASVTTMTGVGGYYTTAFEAGVLSDL